MEGQRIRGSHHKQTYVYVCVRKKIDFLKKTNLNDAPEELGIQQFLQQDQRI